VTEIPDQLKFEIISDRDQIIPYLNVKIFRKNDINKDSLIDMKCRKFVTLVAELFDHLHKHLVLGSVYCSDQYCLN